MYIIIENLEEFVVEYLEFCNLFELKGRIFVVKEGINGICFGIVE